MSFSLLADSGSSPAFSAVELDAAIATFHRWEEKRFDSKLSWAKRMTFAAPSGDEVEIPWWQITHQAADEFTGEVKKVVDGAVGLLKDGVEKASLIAFLEVGDVTSAVALFDWDLFKDQLEDGFKENFANIALRAGADTAAQLGKGLDYDEFERASFFERGARIAAKRIAGQTRKALFRVMRRLVVNGISAFRTANYATEVAGLAVPAANAATNYVLGREEEGAGYRETMAKLKERVDKALEERADTISRTEALNVAQVAQEDAIRQHTDVGAIKNVVKVWVTIPDNARCPICTALNKQRRAQDDLFEDPDTGLVYSGPPAHQRCRCGLRYLQARRSEAVGVFVVDIRTPEGEIVAREAELASVQTFTYEIPLQFHLSGKHDQKAHGRKGARVGSAIAKEAGTPCPPPCLDIDPFQDVDGDGITDHSRLGVVPNGVPDEIPNIPNLTAEERAAEQRFSDAYEKDPGAMASAYREQVLKHSENGNTFNTDDAKMLSGDYNNGDPEAKAFYNVAVHGTANAVAKRAFVDHLEENKGLPDDEKIIVVTSGGVAAGKGFSVAQSPEISARSKGATAVWDAAGEQNATENQWVLEEAKKRGYKVTYVYVHADPNTSWAGTPERGGAVTRAQKKGRMVNEKMFAESYELGAKNFEAFANRNRNDPDVEIAYFDNATGGKPKKVPKMPSAALTFKANDIEKKARTYIDKEFEGGSIPEWVYRGGTNSRYIWPSAQ